jgi:sugar phosphate isomerase/epimerase
LAPLGDQPRAALDRLASMGFRHVQLSAAQPGLRPRDLDRSARRDLLARLRRLAMSASGLDLWIPSSHLVAPAQVDRAVTALLGAIELAGQLGRCPVSVSLAADDQDSLTSIVETVTRHAGQNGVEVADHAVPPVRGRPVGVGIDPAAWLVQEQDPAEAVSTYSQRLASIRLCDLLTSGTRGPIGEPGGGRLDVHAYRDAIVNSGYRRPLVVDVRQWSEPWRGLEQCARAWTIMGAEGSRPEG